MGALRARLISAMTMGSRMPAAMYSISHIRAIPLALVAVSTRPPAAAAPMQALMALCSLSTVTRLVLTTPSATYFENSSMTWVEGVMG